MGAADDVDDEEDEDDEDDDDDEDVDPLVVACVVVVSTVTMGWIRLTWDGSRMVWSGMGASLTRLEDLGTAPCI